jgi:hypothetical protein
MFDSETLRPVMIAMVLFIVLVHATPKVFKGPTDIKPLDDVVMLCVTLRGFLRPGASLMGLVTYLTNYVNLTVL